MQFTLLTRNIILMARLGAREYALMIRQLHCTSGPVSTEKFILLILARFHTLSQDPSKFQLAIFILKIVRCVNGAPHNAGYNIGTCSITGGPLATWKCSNGQLTYENPCYEAFLSSQSTYSSGSSSQYYQTYGSNNNNPSNSEEERLILAVDSSFGVYLMNGAYLSAEQHRFNPY